MITSQQGALGEKIDLFLIRLLPGVVAAFFIYAGYMVFRSDGVLRLSFFAIHLSGFIVSLLIVARMLGMYRHLTNRLCSQNNEKIGCDSVLSSRAEYIVGEITWGDAGVLYFACMLLLSLFPFRESTPYYLIGAFVSTPYILFSIAYQGLVARSWCPLCLVVQLLLFLQFLSALRLATSHPVEWHFSLIVPMGLLCMIVVCSYFAWKSLLVYRLSGKAREQNFKRMRAAYISFFVTDEIPTPGYLVFNPDAENRITCVFRFGCPPCIDHLSKILDLAEQNKTIALELVFTTQPQYLKQELPLMLYFASFYRTRSEKEFIEELRNYLHTFPMSRKRFASRWQEKNLNSDIGKVVRDCICWCKEHRLQITPAYLLNGRVVNPFYDIDDVTDRICSPNHRKG